MHKAARNELQKFKPNELQWSHFCSRLLIRQEKFAVVTWAQRTIHYQRISCYIKSFGDLFRSRTASTHNKLALFTTSSDFVYKFIQQHHKNCTRICLSFSLCVRSAQIGISQKVIISFSCAIHTFPSMLRRLNSLRIHCNGMRHFVKLRRRIVRCFAIRHRLLIWMIWMQFSLVCRASK